jgi:hypothetical protein
MSRWKTLLAGAFADERQRRDDSWLRHLSDAELADLEAQGEGADVARFQKLAERREFYREQSTCVRRVEFWTPGPHGSERRTFALGHDPADADCRCLVVALESDALWRFLTRRERRPDWEGNFRHGGRETWLRQAAERIHNNPELDPDELIRHWIAESKRADKRPAQKPAPSASGVAQKLAAATRKVRPSSPAAEQKTEPASVKPAPRIGSAGGPAAPLDPRAWISQKGREGWGVTHDLEDRIF